MHDWLPSVLAMGTLLLAIPGAWLSYIDAHERRRAQREQTAEPTRTRPLREPGTGGRSDVPGGTTGAESAAAADDRYGEKAIHDPTRDRADVVGLGRRVVSFFIDVYTVATVAGVVSGTLFDTEGQDEAAPAGFYVVLVVAVAVLVLWMTRNGRSPGKLLTGTRVVSATDPQRLPRVGQAIVHLVLSAVLNYLFCASYLYARRRLDRRTLHELAAGTHVVSTR